MLANPKLKTILFQILGFSLTLGILVYYYGIFLPFLAALFMGFALQPFLLKLQKRIKNWDLLVSLFLASIALLILSSTVFLGAFLNRDFQRFSKSIDVLLVENQDNLDAGAEKIKDYLQVIYPSENLSSDLKNDLQKLLNSPADSSKSALDFDALGESFEKLKALLPTSKTKEESSRPAFSSLYLWGAFLLYFVLILYQWPYFQKVKERYFKGFMAERSQAFWQDFDQSFLRYFRLRTKIILWLMPLYLVAFILLDMPGISLLLIALFLLLYIPYFHYLLLIPIALGCVVLSVEQAQSFLFFFGISTGVFVLASIIEEALLIPRIMEKNIGMNPVIMVLGLSFWTFTLGNLGILIGIPITSLVLIYTKRYLLPLYLKEA
jgi:predicted PurR-regulated permease PerM